MKVLKFGGTSLGNPERMKHVLELVLQGKEEQKWVVLSAVSGTTNTLYDIADKLENGKDDNAVSIIEELREHYSKYILELLESEELRGDAMVVVDSCLRSIRSLVGKSPWTEDSLKVLVAQGELISTQLFRLLLKEKNIDSILISALDFMRINAQGEPDLAEITANLRSLKNDYEDKRVVVTQGFICKNHLEGIDNLKRGGSDFSASIIGACLGVDEIQIWTDIDGMHNNDPRIVKNTRPISKLTFDEAAELAYFGAKVLHPSTILPARRYNVPVRIKNTLKPEADGTVISKVEPGWKGGVKAVAAKDGIIAIKIRSSRMLMAYGFLRNIFEIFERFETPIDMITTSEVAVSLTIDNPAHLMDIVSNLEPFGEVEVDYDMSIICVVGNGVAEDKGMVSRIFNGLEETQVRMISYGGSRNNISVLVKTSLKKEALEGLNQEIFDL